MENPILNPGMEKPWLQGGPFLEASFLHLFQGSYREFAVDILNQLKTHLKHLEICLTPIELETKLSEFDKGQDFDEQVTSHILEVPIFLDVGGKRRSIFRIDQISSVLLKVEFLFYGSQSDIPAWQMIGINETDFPTFKEFVIDVFRKFKFEIGALRHPADRLRVHTKLPRN